MEGFLKAVGAIVLIPVVLAAVLGITWLAQGNEFFLRRYFAPKFEDVRRETFEHSKAFNQGMVQELQNMQFEYLQASEEHKAALASVILHRAADYDESKLPADLRQFINDLKRRR